MCHSEIRYTSTTNRQHEKLATAVADTANTALGQRAAPRRRSPGSPLPPRWPGPPLGSASPPSAASRRSQPASGMQQSMPRSTKVCGATLTKGCDPRFVE
eukprot:9010552-Alexandrium_andersonii.AAC.1